MMADEVGRRCRPAMKGGQGKLRDIGRIAEPAVGYDARRPPLPQAGDQDIACRSGMTVAPAVNDQHMAWRTFLDRPALRMQAILEYAEVVDIFARGNIAQRVGRPRHPAGLRIEWHEPTDEGVAQAPF